MTSFVRTDFDEPVQRFHDRPVDAGGRRLWVPLLGPERTLVLGSSQPLERVDAERAAAAGVGVARRRTGGGAVLVSAADLVWFDVLIDRHDPLWSNDVARAFEWLGESCRSALESLGHRTVVHRGPPTATAWSGDVCFAGLGAGELTLDGAKVIGISQRRTRDAARFQVAVVRRWRPGDYTDLLRLTDGDRMRARRELESLARGIPDEPNRILSAVETALPD